MEDLSDNEREEQLRRWWSENWLWIVGGVALGLAALAGYQYWQQTRFRDAEQDEASYLAVLDTLSRNDRTAAATAADQLRSLHPKSPYADQADLALARSAAEARDFDTAAKRLRAVADGSRDEQLRLIAKSRLARVLSQQGKHDEALALLDTATAGAFTPLYHDIRGDIFTAKGDTAAAAREYDSALTESTGSNAESGIDRAFTQLKRDALGSPGAPMAANEAAPVTTPATTTAAPTGATGPSTTAPPAKP